MKKIYALTLLCFVLSSLCAQVNINQPWTWKANNKHIPSRPAYGIKGTPSADNTPGGRKEAMVWQWGNTVYLFGGYGFGGNTVGYLNDLWKLDVATNQWTWINGDNNVNQLAIYGSAGVSAPENKPGSRRNASGLVDAAGNLWLLGGLGYDETAQGALSDLWRYNPTTNEWTWYAGPKTINYAGSYGTQGVSSSTNWPAGHHGVSLWQDGFGKVWIFGGHGSGATAYSDLWKFDPNIEEWTWMGNGGPAARSSKMNWADNSGNLYLFGGITGGATVSNPAAVGSNNINQGTRHGDLWKYTQSTNTWTMLNAGTGTAVWGTKGLIDPANGPGRRNDGAAWKDLDGNLWLQGGTLRWANGAVEYYHDVWKYDLTLNQWAWMHGTAGNGSGGTAGTKGVPSVDNIQSSFNKAVSWTDEEGKFWMFGGEQHGFISNIYRNTVWKYDPLTNETTWINGDDNWYAEPSGDLGVATATSGPGERAYGGGWYDNNGNFWLFSGNRTRLNPSAPNTIDRVADLWKYNISSGQWTWMHGTFSPAQANYGTTGVPAPTNKPSAKAYMHTWTDNANNLWLFSGEGVSGNTDDLWKYDIASNQWTFIRGRKANSSNTTWGTQGIPHIDNTPGSRMQGFSWKDNADNFYLYGGRGGNDLWHYNIASNMWTWIKGSNTLGQAATYGTKGTAAPTNNPGSTQGGVSWTDNNGNFWMFGGVDFNGGNRTNELWKYDPVTNEWTWMHGNNTANVSGVYGTHGTASASNVPGSRAAASGWKDAMGNLWLFGGLGYDADGNYGELNDLWMYNTNTNQWTWVRGDATIAQNGVYGVKGVPNVNNKPGSRYAATAWTDGLNNFWLYGGQGYGEWGKYFLADLWTISAPILGPLPVRLLEFKGQLVNNDGVLNWKADNEESAASYIVERSTDRQHYTAAGTIAANNTPGKHSYNFTDPDIDGLGAPVVYYRLKQMDIDGRSTYSKIIALTIDRSSLVLFYPNPVRDKANLTITLDKAEQIQVRVVSNSGAVVKQLQWKLAAGSTVEEIDMTALASGQYYLELTGERTSKRISFLKK